jgi:hypothetical protein
MRKILILLVTFLATQSFAATEWSDREICRAAAKTYFWLSDLPSDAPDQNDYMGFRSAAQNYYTCRIDGNNVDFVWKNDASVDMRSQNTKFIVRGNELTVTTDLAAETFKTD